MTKQSRILTRLSYSQQLTSRRTASTTFSSAIDSSTMTRTWEINNGSAEVSSYSILELHPHISEFNDTGFIGHVFVVIRDIADLGLCLAG